MKLKRVILPLAIMSTTAPIAAVVSCGNGSEKSNNDGIDALSKQIAELKEKLNDKKSEQNKDASQKSNEINDLTKQIAELQGKLDSLSKPAKIVVPSQEERLESYQAFQSLHQKETSVVNFSDLKTMLDTNVPMPRGIEHFSLDQSCSYLYNLALKLGFKSHDKQLTDLSTTKSADVSLDSDRHEIYEHVSKMFNELKPMSQQDMETVFNSDSYKNFFYMYANGAIMNKQRLDSSFIDQTSFGTPDGGKLENVHNYSNFKLKTSNNTEVSLFSEWKPSWEGYVDPNIMLMQYIDGDKPGTTITKLYMPASYVKSSELNENREHKSKLVLDGFTKSVTVDNAQLSYPVAPIEDEKHNQILIEGLIRKLYVIFSPENKESIDQLRIDAVKYNVSLDFVDALEFLGTAFNAENGFTMQDVKDAYIKLNNGSHYFKVVEIFARGLAGVDFEKNHDYQPSTDASYAGILGMSVDHIQGSLLPWSVLQGYGSYTVGSNTFAPIDVRTYKPSK